MGGIKRNCKGCGKSIWFVKDQKGKTHPLDLQSVVYSVEADMLDEEYAVRAPANFFVSHFQTCPKANDFSGSKRQ